MIDDFMGWAHQSADDSDALLQKWALEDRQARLRQVSYGDDFIDWEEVLGRR